jgi:hypothetical protein
VFRKPKVLKSGKKAYRWYYYWIDGGGKQIQRACSGCKTRGEAEDYIRALPLPDCACTESNRKVLIRDIAGDMYLPGSLHYKRRKAHGKSTDPDTRKEARGIINHIIADFGDIFIDELTQETVDTVLVGKDSSGSRKNRMIQILGEIYQEAPYYG